MDTRTLVVLTKRLRDEATAPIFSILISRHKKLVYEAYTSSLGREHAHYMMSATKSVLSALVGAAIDRGLLRGPDQPVSEALPPRLFGSEENRASFRTVTLAHVLGMSVFDASDPPRDKSPPAWERHHRFFDAPNRARVALTRPLLPAVGSEMQYNDSTPTVAAAAVAYAAHETVLEFGEEVLFHPMGFRNVEWMHQDPSGLDLGGYGLRLRPIDMQKFGNLYLANGVWNGKQLLSRDWVERSFKPWNKSRAGGSTDYGWFWWQHEYGPGWMAHLAKGWKGQRIAVFRDQDLVVTTTGCFEPEYDPIFDEIIRRYVMPAVVADHDAPRDTAAEAELATLLREVQRGPQRGGPTMERRMVPSIEPKEKHRRLDETL
jgi:CubicO group peptidase (beta-lactamase class C family)